MKMANPFRPAPPYAQRLSVQRPHRPNCRSRSHLSPAPSPADPVRCRRPSSTRSGGESRSAPPVRLVDRVLQRHGAVHGRSDVPAGQERHRPRRAVERHPAASADRRPARPGGDGNAPAVLHVGHDDPDRCPVDQAREQPFAVTPSLLQPRASERGPRSAPCPPGPPMAGRAPRTSPRQARPAPRPRSPPALCRNGCDSRPAGSRRAQPHPALPQRALCRAGPERPHRRGLSRRTARTSQPRIPRARHTPRPSQNLPECAGYRTAPC